MKKRWNGAFKFGSGETPTAKMKIRPKTCPKCHTGKEIVLVTGSFGQRGWMCRLCASKFRSFMMKHYLKEWSIQETDVMGRAPRIYAYRVHETSAALIADRFAT